MIRICNITEPGIYYSLEYIGSVYYSAFFLVFRENNKLMGRWLETISNLSDNDLFGWPIEAGNDEVYKLDKIGELLYV